MTESKQSQRIYKTWVCVMENDLEPSVVSGPHMTGPDLDGAVRYVLDSDWFDWDEDQIFALTMDSRGGMDMYGFSGAYMDERRAEVRQFRAEKE